MTAKEKAKELVDKMYGQTPVRGTISEIEIDKQYAKQCALIAVDEIIESCNFVNKWYWEEVKQEIEKL